MTITGKDMGASLYVGNLPYKATEEAVRNLFLPLGNVQEVTLKQGYGFIDFQSPEDVKNVVSEVTRNPIALEGRTLNVEERSPNTDKTRSRGGKNKRIKSSSGQSDHIGIIKQTK